MLERLLKIDQEVFLFLNGIHNHTFDFIMFWASNKFIWIPLYLIFLYLILKFYRKRSILIIFFLIATITISDQVSVHAFKNVFMRLRPCHEPSLDGLVHIVKEKCGGSFGFISSHASNHFALASFLSVILGDKIKFLTIIIYLWAGFIAYSRIYLGVHYPGDVLVGSFAGTGIGFSFAFAQNKIFSKFN